MRKLFIGIVALAALVACSNESVIEAPDGTIAFGDMFIQNSSSKPMRSAADPTYNNETNPLEAFYAWGFMEKNTGVVFNKELVTRTEYGWVYDNLAYWCSFRTYRFAALAPVNHSNIEIALADGDYISNDGGLGTVTFTNLDGTDDLLYAATAPIKIADITAETPAPIQLMFKHLLSKVKFTFVNGFANTYNSVTISNVKMKVPAKGTVDLTGDINATPAVWSVKEGEESVVLSFGDVTEQDDESVVVLGPGADGEALNERLIIPVANPQDINLTYEVTFDMTLYQGDQVAYSATKTAVIAGEPFVAGRAYDIRAVLSKGSLGLHEITFSVAVEPWEEYNVDDKGVTILK